MVREGLVDLEQLAPVAGVGPVAVHRELDHVGVAVGVGVVGVELAPVAREGDAEEAPLATGGDLVAEVEHRPGVDRADRLGDHVRLRVGRALDLQASDLAALLGDVEVVAAGPGGEVDRRVERGDLDAASAPPAGMAVGPAPAPPSVVEPVAPPAGAEVTVVRLLFDDESAPHAPATSATHDRDCGEPGAGRSASSSAWSSSRCAHRETRSRPSWTTVTARWPSWVKIEPVAVPRPPEADGRLLGVEQPLVGAEGAVEPHGVVEASHGEVGLDRAHRMGQQGGVEQGHVRGVGDDAVVQHRIVGERRRRPAATPSGAGAAGGPGRGAASRSCGCRSGGRARTTRPASRPTAPTAA